MPWIGAMSSLWNHAKLYKPVLRDALNGANDCLLCNGVASAASNLCEGCRRDLPRRSPRLVRSIDGVDLALAAFRYAFPVTEFIRAAKFQGDLGALQVLGEAFSDSFLAELGTVDVLVPVPLLPWRYWRRGFNQSGELARQLGARMNLPVRHDIVARRQLWATAQSRLSATERRENVVSAFRVRRDVVGLHIAIVDDVITTGATCGALAGALRAAGADRIVAVAVAATPLNAA